MSNQWLRLWHDMPNDPKFRTIARASKQRIGDVLAVYMHLLTAASQNVTRGHADVTPEDLASAIDVTDDAIHAILQAMQGRVLDGDRLTGWEKRQPKREDSGSEVSGAKSSTERKREQREREKEAAKSALKDAGHAASRNVTTDKDKDKDKDKELKDSVAKATGGKPPLLPEEIIFGYGLPILTNAGTPEKQARSFLGGLRKTHGDDAVVNTLRDCLRAKPLQPLEWLAKALPPPGSASTKPNKQEALEARNAAIAEEWATKTGAEIAAV